MLNLLTDEQYTLAEEIIFDRVSIEYRRQLTEKGQFFLAESSDETQPDSQLFTDITEEILRKCFKKDDDAAIEPDYHDEQLQIHHLISHFLNSFTNHLVQVDQENNATSYYTNDFTIRTVAAYDRKYHLN
ncbi:hypothetical protein BSQ39_02950 [Loigolactobacillus backii]|uniref:hypothetical protein n=1 Tax=Loigolactobacillus backii TaxID=375175 RepID=UPI000C1CAAE1|nr:hypothetical protein [Loigolactobacillus backii]PIO82599.1 hypothetical protein BSQ39_02950 [Loigolactobacillus backii]